MHCYLKHYNKRGNNNNQNKRGLEEMTEGLQGIRKKYLKNKARGFKK